MVPSSPYPRRVPGDSTKRGRYHHGNLPAALVEAALELLETRGAETLTLRELAGRVGVTHAAPYRHFKDKAALLATLGETGHRRLRAALGSARRSVAPAREALAAMAAAHLDFALGAPALYRLMFARAAAPHSETVADAPSDPTPGIAAVLLADVAEAVAALQPGSGGEGIARLARMLIAEWHGLAMFAIGGWLEEGLDAGAIAREATTRLTAAPPAPLQSCGTPAPERVSQSLGVTVQSASSRAAAPWALAMDGHDREP